MIGTGRLIEKLVAKRKNDSYPSMYLLLKFSLILPVATTSVKITFFAMKLVKSELCSRMENQLLNDFLVSYIEKDISQMLISTKLWFFLRDGTTTKSIVKNIFIHEKNHFLNFLNFLLFIFFMLNFKHPWKKSWIRPSCPTIVECIVVYFLLFFIS